MNSHNQQAKIRRYGVLVRYNEERGFGFIKVCNRIPEYALAFRVGSESLQKLSSPNLTDFEDKGFPDVFIHFSALKGKLFLGQWLAFDVVSDSKQQGKVRAVNVCSLEQEAVKWQGGDSEPPANAVPTLLSLWLVDKTNFFRFELYHPLVYTLSPPVQIDFVRKVVATVSDKAFALNSLSSLIRFRRAESVAMGVEIDYNLDLVLETFSSLQHGAYPKFEELVEIVFLYIEEDLTELPKLDPSLFDPCEGRTVQNRKPRGERELAQVGGAVYELGITPNTIMVEGQELPWADGMAFINGTPKPVEIFTEPVYEYDLVRLTKKERWLDYCEGRLSPNPDAGSGKPVWWCRNSRCFASCY